MEPDRLRLWMSVDIDGCQRRAHRRIEHTRWKGVSPISVELRPGESQESLLRRFRKAVAEARILPTVRQKRWFTSKSEIRRIKRQKAIRKSRRSRRSS